MPTIHSGSPLLATVATTGDYLNLIGPPPFMPVGGIWNHTGSSGAAGGIYNSAGPAWSAVTSLVVSGTDAHGDDRSALLNLIQVGDYVCVWCSESSYAAMQVSGISVVGSVYTFDVTSIAAVGNVDSTFTAVYYFGLIYRPPVTLSDVATSGAYSDLSGTPTLATVATTGAYGDLSGTPALATVATTGDYNDLSNKPTGLTQSVALLAPDGTTTVTLNFSNGLLQSVS